MSAKGPCYQFNWPVNGRCADLVYCSSVYTPIFVLDCLTFVTVVVRYSCRFRMLLGYRKSGTVSAEVWKLVTIVTGPCRLTLVFYLVRRSFKCFV